MAGTDVQGVKAPEPTSFLSGFGLSMLAVALGVTGIVFALQASTAAVSKIPR